ncbi:MAG: hypothetical protein PVF91_07665 [Chromatiales bacterium]|jgi:hypothetical protein
MAEESPDRTVLLTGMLVAVGIALTMLGAVRPHFDSAYRLEGGLLFAGLVPYVILGGLAVHLRERLLVGAALLVVLIHLGAILFGGGSLLYWLPPVLGLALLALVPRAMQAARFPRRPGPRDEETPDLTEKP